MNLQATRQARRIGDLRFAAGDPLSARRYYAEAIDEARDIGAEHEQGLASLGLASALLELGDVTRSAPHGEPRWSLLDRAGAPTAEIEAARRLVGRRGIGRGRHGEDANDATPMRVGIVGAGVMAEAMIAGLIANSAVTPRMLAASIRAGIDARRWRSATASTRGGEPGCAGRGGGRGARRQATDAGAGHARASRPAGADQVVLSIVAGATCAPWSTVSSTRPSCGRCPTRPQIRRGMSVWSASEACTARPA